MYNIFFLNSLTRIIKNSLIDLPTPANITYFWNFGSLLGLCLIMQLVTGLFLAIHYSNTVETAFFSVRHITRDVNWGWLLRIIHANGARFFFICLYAHIFRGLYYGSYWLIHTWLSGITLLFLVMATAFLGYVLPWGQISFWGATVITNLFSAVPIIGQDIVYWLWGRFAVRQPTLSRFFTLHFILPFIVLFFVIIHLTILHNTGSRNPLGLNSNNDKIIFYPYFLVKDILGVLVLLFLLIICCFLNPWVLGDPENFIAANPLVTPLHIQPEWYFLFAYAILRSIPNKLGGVIALVLSIAIFYIFPFFKKPKFFTIKFRFFRLILFWQFLTIVIILTWIGARPVETPYIELRFGITIYYFFLLRRWINFNNLGTNFYL